MRSRHLASARGRGSRSAAESTAVALDVLKRSAIGSPMLRAAAPPELPDRAWFDVLELLGAARVLGYEHRDIAVLFQTFSEMIAEAA